MWRGTPLSFCASSLQIPAFYPTCLQQCSTFERFASFRATVAFSFYKDAFMLQLWPRPIHRVSELRILNSWVNAGKKNRWWILGHTIFKAPGWSWMYKIHLLPLTNKSWCRCPPCKPTNILFLVNLGMEHTKNCYLQEIKPQLSHCHRSTISSTTSVAGGILGKDVNSWHSHWSFDQNEEI